MSSNSSQKRRNKPEQRNNWGQKLKCSFLRINFKFILISYHGYPDYAVLNIMLHYTIALHYTIY